jgi:glycosyltransferase involved in cell wall biosynthesis
MKRDCFVALGESNLKQIIDIVGADKFAKTLMRFAGVISVSRANEELCRDHCPSIGDRLIHLPNAVDHKLFFPRDRRDARQKLGLPATAKIVAFCGYFINRKGGQRLLTALERTPDVYGVFLGRGSNPPKGARVLYAGPVDHSMVPWWLSAADVFALPSLAEGMSNAIVEALACGLPVVVSDLPFNHEFLGNDCALFVDPFSVDEISRAILFLFENQDRYFSMAGAAQKRADQFKLVSRANRILDFVAAHTRNKQDV